MYPKTAYKRGRMSFIWEYRTEFRRKGIKKSDRLYNLYWNKKSIFIKGTSITNRAITYLKEVHSIDESGPIPKAVNTPVTVAEL
jgi:hypothetical protein